MSLRKLLMCVVYSLLISLVIYLNIVVLSTGHNLGISLANIMNIDPEMALSIMSAGFANNIMILLFFAFFIIQLLLYDKVMIILDSLDNWLWKKLKY